MKITAIETIQAPEHPNQLWVRIHTDEGVTGYGETYLHAEPVAALLEKTFTPFLLNKDPLDIGAIWLSIFDRCNFFGWAGAEIRAMSAIDIALWDILGQVCGMPIYRVLGGKHREKIKVYNTCGGEAGLDFNVNPADYAASLLESGIKAMKIWPFDKYAVKSGGHYIEREDLKKAIWPIESIKKAFGDKMEVAVEFHGHWDLPTACKIAAALEEYDPMWVEDIIQVDNLDACAQLAKTVRVPLVISERLFTRFQFLPLLKLGIARYVNPDIEWCGGISEAVKIASMADTFRIPVACHNYGGPLLNVVSAHVAAHIPNMAILETGRNLISVWNDGILEKPIRIENGYMSLPEGPGLGNRLSEDFLARKDLVRHMVR